MEKDVATAERKLGRRIGGVALSAADIKEPDELVELGVSTGTAPNEKK